MDVITKSIKDGVSLAYISLLNDYYQLFNDNKTLGIGVIDEDLNSLVNHLKSMFIDIDTIIGSSEDKRADYISTLKTYHGMLENKYKVLSGQSRELTHISFQLEEIYHLKNTSTEEVKGIDYHKFIHDLLEFVESSKEESEKHYKMQEISKFIPMRMTRDFFLNYIEGSISKIASGDEEVFISILKQLYDGRLTDGYNDVFQDISLSIEDIRKEVSSSISKTRVQELFDDINLLKEMIEEFYNVLILLHSAISNFYILLLLDTLNLEILSHSHVAFNDLYLSTKVLLEESLEGQDYEILLETLPDRLEDVYSQISNDFSNSMDKLAKINQSKEKPNPNSINLLGLVQFYLRLNIQDIFSFQAATEDIESLTSSTIETSINLLKEQINSQSPKERKLRMQYLLGVLPVNMDQREFANYLFTGLDGSSNEIKKAYSLAKISDFMDSTGFYDLENEQPQ